MKNTFLNDFTADTVVLIPHKKRQQISININENDYCIQVDQIRKTGRNEDPFIWDKNFLYTFCKANSVNTNYLRTKNPYLVFIAIADEGYVIDTVIKAREYRKWPERGDRTCDKVKKALDLTESEMVYEHFEEFDASKNLIHHDNKVLYTCIGDENMSFIPTINGKALSVNGEICEQLTKVFKTEKNKGYYVAHKNVPRFKGETKEFECLVKKLKECLQKAHKEGKILTAEDLGNKIKSFKIEYKNKWEQFNSLSEYREKLNGKKEKLC